MNEVSSYAKRLNELNRAHEQEMEQRKQELLHAALDLAGKLYDQVPGIVQVWGFGSVFEEGRSISEKSDIDLAIVGGDLLKAVSLAMSCPFRVDVVEVTDDDFSRFLQQRVTLLPRCNEKN